ncbi:hypothetical protein HUO13_11170 [Saccharopolyspora erythraea]|uniref:hypothetical protein n=1 Tax=Saccharopolyspora erythraea TaxID=1836 RepID=UPI001BABA639|nr:hypothetical protein [Saccharopolyspora erythraea]QUG99384.1 hypothetical protein HUO13_11170 [Saccharopolyspora erythraea]
MAELRRSMLESSEFADLPREVVSATLHAWLVFVRSICVEWLVHESFSRSELRELCLGALFGALHAVGGDQRS